MPHPILSALVHGVRELLFPRTCLVCERLLAPEGKWLACEPCLASIDRLPTSVCDRCGHPLPPGRRCATCEVLHPAIGRARSFCWADGATARTLLHALKYDGWTAVSEGMAECLGELAPPDVRTESSCLLSVPLAPVRQRERGYNQSELLARHLARLWRCAVLPDAIRRVRETPTQTLLTRSDRFANVAHAFEVTAGRVPRLRGVSCVLVDDVMTTGATLNACASALDAAGVEHITAITFGRAREPRAATPA